MNREKVVFFGLDASKATLAVSVAEDGSGALSEEIFLRRPGREIRFCG